MTRLRARIPHNPNLPAHGPSIMDSPRRRGNLPYSTRARRRQTRPSYIPAIQEAYSIYPKRHHHRSLLVSLPCILCSKDKLTINRATLLTTQLNYLYHLFYGKPHISHAARTVSTHFTLNNLFLFSWIILWTRNQFSASSVFLLASYLNQHAVYAQHPRLPIFVHLPVVAGPYAWAFLGLFWNVALAVSIAGDANSLPVRVLGNVFIWVIVVVGSGLVVSSSDYLLAYCFAWLSLCLSPSFLESPYPGDISW